MTIDLTSLLRSIAATLALVGSAHAAMPDDFDVDARFRAKVAKEKAKLNTEKASTFNFNANPSLDNPQCGSQNIGNVDTGGKVGAAPREVFVFAPNAINLVTARGCN